MEILNFSTDPDLEKVAGALQQGAIVVNLNHVFAVVALPNAQGVDSLSAVKNRKAGKCYGSLIGDAHEFVEESELDAETKIRFIECMVDGDLDDAFVRLPWGDTENEGLVMGGTHQGLKTTEPVLSFCCSLEKRVIRRAEGFMMNRLICSSANISGDPRGSITNRGEAIQFAKDRGVGLFVEFDFPTGDVEPGSFPIFSFNHMAFSVERQGPGWDKIHRGLLERGFSALR
jgi:hypothetical protein